MNCERVDCIVRRTWLQIRVLNRCHRSVGCAHGLIMATRYAALDFARMYSKQPSMALPPVRHPWLTWKAVREVRFNVSDFAGMYGK
jgi:hypothetical protein